MTTVVDAAPEPLRVRVARALGCRVAVGNGPDPYYACACPGDVSHNGAHAGGIAPYGEDTPEGWAVTGPLISRFRLSFEERTSGLAGMSVWSETDGREMRCGHVDRCRGAAEWVEQHGADVLAQMGGVGGTLP